MGTGEAVMERVQRGKEKVTKPHDNFNAMGQETAQATKITLTEDDYRELAEQCVAQDFGHIERPWGEVNVTMDIDVEFRREDDYFSGTGGAIPVRAECRVKECDACTDDGVAVEVDEWQLEELAHGMVMQY